uniref:LRRCT domain-containing protein n=1 Tax=Clastoptera arizonana TaxID=38151 RepID=A0A1B6D9I9_9HEMI
MWKILGILVTLLAATRCEDITVECLSPEALNIKVGGIVADCSLHGLTRLTTVIPWLTNISTVLQSANMSNNKINYFAKLPLLPRLLTLTLSHNKIKDMESLAVVNLINLLTLDLSYNRITGETLRADVLKGRYAPDRYEPLPIRVLLLGNNEIHSLNRRVFEHLNYLKELRLDHNPLEVIDDNTQMALQSLPELKILDLAKTGLTHLPSDLFQHFELNSLYLNGNQLTSVPDSLGSLAHSLRLININENPIKELNEDSFLGLRNLEDIIASGLSELTAIKANTFSNLENLKTVSCSYNSKLTEIDPFAFWDHKGKFFLKELYLNNNNLKIISKYLVPWDKLDKITLEENPWICDCRTGWLADLVSIRTTTLYRPYDLQCSEPTWLNRTLLIHWKNIKDKNDTCASDNDEEPGRIKAIEEEIGTHTIRNTLIAILLFTIAIAIILGLTFFKYRHYKPLRVHSNTTSLAAKEVRYIKSDVAEKSLLVS